MPATTWCAGWSRMRTCSSARCGRAPSIAPASATRPAASSIRASSTPSAPPTGRRVPTASARDLAEDPAQLDGLARFARNDEFVEALRDALGRCTTAEAIAIFEELGAIWAPVRSYDEVIADPQVLASGYLRRTDHPECGEIVCMGTPLRFSGGVPPPSHIAPDLGQDTELVLEEAGYGWERIAEMRELGAI